MFGFIRIKLISIFKPNDNSKKNGQQVSRTDDLPDTEKEKILKLIKEEREKELNNAPRIAIIGKTGVGKSSTINNLFTTNLGVSHFESCTQKAEPISISNGKGEIIIYDMPGLGEDLEKDEQHKREYKRVLPECDVVLWILNIADREMSSQQQHIKEILEYLEGRLVICANKADLLEPAEWHTAFNMPSKEQEENILRRIADIKKKLCKYIPDLIEERIVFYSAKKRYRLNDLFVAMMEARPVKRAWVLETRFDIADFKELVDSEILKKLTNG
jgi:small GTP-binding protein